MGEEPEPLLLAPGREPLVAVGLSWGVEATCCSREGGNRDRSAVRRKKLANGVSAYLAATVLCVVG